MRLWTLLVIGGLACSAASGVGGGTVESGDLLVATSTDKSTVGSGQSLTITITVTNKMSASRTLQFASGCQTDFEFLDSRGDVAAKSQQMCTQALTQRTLAAGGSFVDTHVWSRAPLEPNQLVPGTYRLRGVLLATRDTVRSAPVDVVVR